MTSYFVLKPLHTFSIDGVFLFFHFASALFKWALAQRRQRRFLIKFTNGSLFPWLSFNLHLWMARWIVSTDNDFWKCSWARAVIIITESCLYLMHFCLRVQRSQASNSDFQPCFLWCLQILFIINYFSSLLSPKFLEMSSCQQIQD